MKKYISLFMGFLMMSLMLAVPVFGSEEDRVMMIVSCPEQNFSTACLPQFTYDYTPDGGVWIQLDEESGGGSVSIFKTDAPGADFAAETYFENAFIDLLVQSYGSSLIDPGEYTVYPFAGKELPGRMALYDQDGETHMRFCLFDLEDDYFLRYEAFSVFDETYAQNAVDVMSDAIRYFQPDAMYYYDEDVKDQNAGMDSADLQVIDCPEQGFSVMADPSYSWNYQDENGITIYTEIEGSIPYVMVYRCEDLYMEPYEYIKEQYTPHVEEKYGQDLLNMYEEESLEIGGKQLPAGIYRYELNGHVITLIRIMDSTGPQTVIYTAKFEEGYGEPTLKALDTVIRTLEAQE